ncbi:MAG: 7-cyano-7-deazaguanine synthase QueC [Candidatus Riflebacteria bacterium]|nr:7-cyano-7-deazaguanine synthase QueC [Candidatus Riflebacteria bacterium]
MGPGCAVVLLSGGLDSTTALAIARSERFVCHTVAFDYGQRHDVELAASARVSRHFEAASHRVIRLDLRAFGGSALTADLEVPKNREPTDSIPVTYVPARNTILLSIALGLAEVLGTGHLFIGVNAVDYSGYPDCRRAFVESFERMANLALKAAVEGKVRVTIHAPLIEMTKGQIIRRGMELGVDYSLTHSCYDPDDQGRACGACDSCALRLRGFAEAGLIDPVRYAVRTASGS